MKAIYACSGLDCPGHAVDSLAYIDVYGAFVPCKVMHVEQGGKTVIAKVTAERGPGWPHGTAYTLPASSVPPRSHVCCRRGQYRVLDRWTWRPGSA